MTSRPPFDAFSGFLTPTQAAQIAGVTPQAVRYWDREGRLKGVVRTPLGRLIPASEIERQIERRTEQRELNAR